MKPTTLIVLGGLLFAGTTLAAEPQQAHNPDAAHAASNSGMKVGIDPTTGKLRRLTAAESAQLDALAATRQKSAAAKAKTSAKAIAADGPTTFISNGLVIEKLPDEMREELHATIGADGKVVYGHDVASAQEAASE